MKRLSWRTAALLATGWIVLTLGAGAVLIEQSMRSFAVGGSGGLAAIGGGVSPRAALIVFGPPVVLLVARLLAPRLSR